MKNKCSGSIIAGLGELVKRALPRCSLPNLLILGLLKLAKLAVCKGSRDTLKRTTMNIIIR